jgi:hypothetical protein
MPFLSLIVLGVMIFSLVDIIRRDDSQVKHLPKTMWVIIVILLPIIGTVLWFALGRVYPDDGPRMPRPSTRTMPAPVRREERTTEQQLADLEREIEEDRLRRELDRRRRDQRSAD